MTKKRLTLLFLVTAFIAVLYMLNFFVKGGKPEDFSKSLVSTTNNIANEIIPNSTPIPFESMTIPSLRAREYKSTLGEMTKYQDAANYTSYLTSYESDGNKINGLLTVPKSDGPHPAIVFVHGYVAPSIYRTTERYVDYVNYLARNGFVVFKIDLRGHGDSEGAAGGGYYSEGYVVDTLNAYSALQNADFVNPGKIGLWGHSMAGNVTFRSLVAKQDIPAVVVWGGAGYTYDDLREYQIDDNSYRPPATDSPQTRERQRLRDTYGQFDGAHEFWRQVTPMNYLSGITTPMQIHHAVDDTVVSVDYARNLDKKLEGTGINLDVYEYSSGGHNISGSSFGTAMQRTVDFFKEKLK